MEAVDSARDTDEHVEVEPEGGANEEGRLVILHLVP